MRDGGGVEEGLERFGEGASDGTRKEGVEVGFVLMREGEGVGVEEEEVERGRDEEVGELGEGEVAEEADVPVRAKPEQSR